MKKLLIIAMLILTSEAQAQAMQAAPFSWESSISPMELVQWKTVPNDMPFDHGTFTYMVKVIKGKREALLLIQVPHDRLVGYAYYEHGKLMVYNVSILLEIYKKIPISRQVRKLVEQMLK